MTDDILDQNIGISDLHITPEIKTFLRETAKWSKFLSIIGFVFVGLFALIALGVTFFSGFALSNLGEAGTAVPKGMFGTIGIVYFLIALLYVLPFVYMYKFAQKMKIALAQNDQLYLAESFKNLKSLYKFMGVFMLVIVVIYGIMLLFGVLGALFAGF